MIKQIAKVTSLMQYTMAKVSPASGGITLTTVVSMYTGVHWLLAFMCMVSIFIGLMVAFYYSGLFKAEQRYTIGELGVGKDG
jgi:cobalamin biosynthesis protein CobD/CbiB